MSNNTVKFVKEDSSTKKKVVPLLTLFVLIFGINLTPVQSLLIEGSAAVGAAVGGGVAVIVGVSNLHQIHEGHVGLYYRGGALTDRVTEPGWHMKAPFDHVIEVQTTVQSDSVLDIPCGTSGGVVIRFGKIEVVNRLKKELALETVRNYTASYDRLWIYDKVHHEMNQFCSSHTLREIYIDLFSTIDERLKEALQSACDVWAPGIEIIAVRVTKPVLPREIEENFRQTEEEKAKLLRAIESQRVTEKEAETARMKARMEAEQSAEVSAIRVQQELKEKEGAKRVAAIEAEIMLNRQRAEAEANALFAKMLAETNKELLTPEYLTLRTVEELGKGTRTYFGPSIPTTLLDAGSFASAFKNLAVPSLTN
jgi:regulator of protease activity HflC (stomatin/prohibitin superfamily)